MTKLQALRVLVNERLSAAAEEIFVLFERTIAEYEEENQRKQRLLEEVKPGVLQPRAGMEVHIPSLNPSLNQDITLTPQMKAEPEEVQLLQTIAEYEEENQRKQRLLEEVKPGVLPPRAGMELHVPSASPPGPSLNHKATGTARIKEETKEQSVKQEGEQPGFVPESMAVCVKAEESSLHRQNEHRAETQEDDITVLSSDDDDDADWKHLVSPADAWMMTEPDGDQNNQVQTGNMVAQTSDHSPTLHNGDTPRTDEASEARKHQCSFCHKMFLTNPSLRMHIRIHTGERPFACSVCEKTFIQKGHLQTHMKTHTGQKPFSCPYCKKMFAIKSNLRIHVRIHTGETPYSCLLCDKRFTDSSNLKKHMKTHIKQILN